MRLNVSVLALTAALLSGGIVSAHHSFAATYVEDKVIRIEGKVVAFNIRNPHSNITIEVTDKDGKTTRWGGEWGSVTQLSQAGVTGSTLAIGDLLIIEGAPPRDFSDPKVLVRKVTRAAPDKKPAFEWSGTVR